jgi:hypothetical protein
MGIPLGTPMTAAQPSHPTVAAPRGCPAPLNGRQWLYLAAFICLAVTFYFVSYWTDPNLPGRSMQYPLGWWGWFDQGQYYRSVVALEQHNYTPTEHLYPLGYPLIGTLFFSLMPQHPFFIPDLCCCILICLAFIDICRRLVLFRVALILCFFGVMWSTSVQGNLVRPWTNIPTNAALMTLACLALAQQRDRRRSIVTGICAGLIFAVRPGDVLYAWPAMAALWLGCHSWREALQRARWFAAGAAPLAGIMLYYSFTIHGQLVSKAYAEATAHIGFGFASWNLKLYTFCVDGFSLFGESRTLITVFPLLFLTLPGLAVFIKTLRWRGLAVALTQVGAVIYFLAFNDYWVVQAFQYHGIRYWLWLIPFIGLYAYLTLTVAWRSLGWIPTCLLIAVPLAVWGTTRMEIRPVFAEPPSPAASTPTDGWHCMPDAQSACTVLLEFPKPVEFDILKLQGLQPAHLLYARVWVDGHLNPMFHSHYFSAGGDGQALIMFYRRQRCRSLRVTIPPPSAAKTLVVTGVRFYQREWKVALEHPLRSYHPQPAARL